MNDRPAAIVVDRLIKNYGPRRAVDDLSFRVEAGEIFALLGPNGAGKTTTIEILEGYRRRDGGAVRVLGHDPERAPRDLRCRIGLMLQEGGIYPQARPREILALFAAFYPTPDDPDRLLDLVGLADAVKTPYRRLSGGQKQRLSLALALIGRPELVFLDEPTAGLDPRARRSAWDLIGNLRRQGVTVLLTTHYLEEAERLADRIAIVDRGRLIALGDLSTLRRGQETVVRIVTAAPVDLAHLATVPGAGAVRVAQPGIYLIETAAPPRFLTEVSAWAERAGVTIEEIRVGHETLEELFLRLTGHGVEE